MLPVFLEKIKGQTHLPTPDRIRDFAGLSQKSSPRLSIFSKIVRQGYRTFSKKLTNVIDLSKKSPAKSPDIFSKYCGFPENRIRNAGTVCRTLLPLCLIIPGSQKNRERRRSPCTRHSMKRSSAGFSST